MAVVSVPSLSQIREISHYFDSLVNFVPAHHYFDPEEAISLRYMNKAERASTKASFKQQHKQTKRAKLDPDRDRGTVSLQHERDAGGCASTSKLPLVSLQATQPSPACANHNP
jgi:hypothetical protein